MIISTPDSALVSALDSHSKGPGFDSRAGRYEDGLYILKCLAPVHLAVSRYGMLVGGCVLAFPGELREEVSGLVKMDSYE